VREAVRMVVVLLAVCLISGLALAAVEARTSPVIAAQAEKDLQAALVRVLPGAASFEPVPFEKGAVKQVWKAGEAGWVVESAPTGYGGPVRLLIGVGPDGAIVRLEVLSAVGETPGLGSRVASFPFVNQFTTQSAQGGLRLVKGKVPSPGEIQAITGATISSRAVLDGVNEALAAVAQLQR
jgi:Na+-translocating ferredoxin:NAD+ oxidoreductase subunit G